MGRWLAAGLLFLATSSAAQVVSYEDTVKRVIELQPEHMKIERTRPVDRKAVASMVRYATLPPPPGYKSLSVYHEQAMVRQPLPFPELFGSAEEQAFQRFKNHMQTLTPAVNFPGSLTIHAERITPEGIERIIINDHFTDAIADTAYIGRGADAAEAKIQLDKNIIYERHRGAEQAKSSDYACIIDWIRSLR